MCILSKNKERIGRDGFIGTKMFDRDFVMSLAHSIATKYFPKKDDFIFCDSEAALSLAKRACICALQKGISMKKLEYFAKNAPNAEAFNLAIAKHFGRFPEEPNRWRPYINLYKNEKKVLIEVFGLNEKEIDDLVWGRFSSFYAERLYSKLEDRAYFFNKKLSVEKNTADTIIKFLSIRWGLNDGFPKPIRAVGAEMGLSDLNNKKIKKLMDEIFDGLLGCSSTKTKSNSF